MGRLFGTDGIRGIFNEDLTTELATKVGYAAAHVLSKNQNDITVLIGRDTRFSGKDLLNALTEGFNNAGANVIDLGIISTPAVSYLVKEYNATMGVMISASHNPSEYNGIKLFDSNGFKLPDNIEDEIEEYILNGDMNPVEKIGTFTEKKDASDDYINHLINSIQSINKDLKIVVDCSNGSASVTAEKLFNKLGLSPIVIHKEFDGYNINDKCGSTHLHSLINSVQDNHADIGIAYDGDADRCLLVDEEGSIVDGDFILAIAGNEFKKENKLNGNAIVGTVMSNLGLKKFCEKENINFIETKVGDRYVLQNMLENDYVIGGEQSGHIIFKEYANTGDGQLTSLQILQIMSKENKSLKQLASIMQVYPQVLVNAKATKKAKEEYKNDEQINSLINEIENSLKDNGRVLIRPSGTENLIRVMIEGQDINLIEEYANKIANLIESKFQ